MTIEDIALQMTPGIGVKGAVHLLGVFGSARDIFAAAPDELAGEAGLREEIAREIVRRRGFAAAEKELEHCRRNGIAAIASTDPEYPPLLREIPDYPHVLYIKGDTAALSARCLSMVGTRNATPYGQTMCNRRRCRDSASSADWLSGSTSRRTARHWRRECRPSPCWPTRCRK